MNHVYYPPHVMAMTGRNSSFHLMDFEYLGLITPRGHCLDAPECINTGSMKVVGEGVDKDGSYHFARDFTTRAAFQ